MRFVDVLRIRLQIVILSALLIALSGGQAHAADVTLPADMTQGKSWVSTGVWSDGAAASAGNDYFVGRDRAGNSVAGKLCRTPENANGSFLGDTLNIGTSGRVGCKPTTTGSKTNTYTIPDLRLSSGTLTNINGSGSIAVIVGTITLSGTPSISAGGATRTLRIDAKLQGTSDLTLNAGAANADSFLLLTNNDNTLSGTLTHAGGIVNTSAAGVLGNLSSYTMNNSTCVLAPKADLMAPTTDLVITTSGAKLQLDFNVQVKSLTVQGQKLDDGIYKSTDLATPFSAQVTGAATLTVGGAPNGVNRWMSFE